jgi:hypothetical protein
LNHPQTETHHRQAGKRYLAVRLPLAVPDSNVDRHTKQIADGAWTHLGMEKASMNRTARCAALSGFAPMLGADKVTS